MDIGKIVVVTGISWNKNVKNEWKITEEIGSNREEQDEDRENEMD